MLHVHAAMSDVRPQVFQQQDLLTLCRPKLPNAGILLLALIEQADEGEQRKEGKHGVRGRGEGIGGGKGGQL